MKKKQEQRIVESFEGFNKLNERIDPDVDIICRKLESIPDGTMSFVEFGSMLQKITKGYLEYGYNSEGENEMVVDTNSDWKLRIWFTEVDIKKHGTVTFPIEGTAYENTWEEPDHWIDPAGGVHDNDDDAPWLTYQ